MLENNPFNIIINKIKMEDIECVFESVSGSGSLYISDHRAAQNLQLLQSKGIRAILSVARSGLVSHKREDIPHYLFIPAEDHEDYPINLHFDQTFDFIEKARKQTNILIHCMAGISRSVTIVIAYLLKRYRHTIGQVVTMVQRRRRKINPNKGFIRQLKQYSHQLGIRCDFQGEAISPVRESSASKQIRAYSAKKYQSSKKRTELQAPIVQMEKDIKNLAFSEICISHNEDMTTNGIKNDDLVLKKAQTYSLQAKINELNVENIKQPKEQKVVLELKASFSTEQNKLQRKRSKIQDKINKIRQKIIRTDQISRRQICKSMQGINIPQTQNKQNKNLIKMDHLLPNYQSAHSPEESQKLLHLKLKQCPKGAQISYKHHVSIKYRPQEVNVDLFSSFKIEPKTFNYVPQSCERIDTRLRQEINT